MWLKAQLPAGGRPNAQVIPPDATLIVVEVVKINSEVGFVIFPVKVVSNIRACKHNVA